MNEIGLSKGELENISRKYSLEELINKEGKQYKKRNLQYMTYNLEHELLEDALLFKTPIVRNGKEVTLGYEPDTWKEWINSET